MASDRSSNGRFTPGNRARVSKAAKPPGVTGVVSYSGNVASPERSSDLIGSHKWVTLSNSYHVPVIATGLRYFGNLLAGTEWHCVENEAGGRNARKGVQLIEEGLLNSPMLKPWPQIVRKASMYRPLGFSIHATAMRRRPGGSIVYSSIEHRPQHTIDKWLREAEDQPFHSVVQRSPQSCRDITIKLDECFYCVDDTLTDSPDGIGLLRHVIEYVRRLGVFEEQEGSALVRDMGGTPVGSAPLSEIATGLAGTDDEKRAQLRQAAAPLLDVMENRNKSPERAMYWLKDSDVYRDTIGNPTGTPKWALDIIRSETANMAQMDVAIRRIELQIARVLGIEFALMGADGKGSYAQHEDKTSMFATNLQTTLNELGWFATMQLARRLVAANGLDPDTCCPRLVAEPISTEAVLSATQALANLSVAGLHPKDPARNVIRGRLRLPAEPEEAITDLMPPRGTAPDPEDPTLPDDVEDQDVEQAPADTDKPARKRKRRSR